MAREVLASHHAEVEEEVNAAKEKIDSDAAWTLLKKHKTIVIGKGKKYSEFEPSEENKEAILKAAIGRSGNLRAPSVKIGETLVIGYNEEMYRFFVS